MSSRGTIFSSPSLNQKSRTRRFDDDEESNQTLFASRRGSQRLFVVLVMGFNFCAATDQACFDAGDRMFLMMAVLSFPAGFSALCVASLLFLEPPASVDQLNDYVTFWLIMAGAGYLQWFVIIPRLFTKPNFTTLNLEETKTFSTNRDAARLKLSSAQNENRNGIEQSALSTNSVAHLSSALCSSIL